MSLPPALYRHAFNQYLRKGTPIERTLQALLTKADHPTTHYIWRTRSDDKVRSAHAANNGKIFAWDNPPETGHPGEDYGCRCTAEPYYGEITPEEINSLRNYLLAYLESFAYWKNFEMSLYFFIGNGNAIILEQMGHLYDIINHYETHYIEQY